MTAPTGLATPDNNVPLSPLGWLTVYAVLLAGLAWYWFSSYAVPGCDTRENMDTLTGGKFSLDKIKQVGYSWSQKSRGCLATVTQDGKALQFAWTITRVQGRRRSRVEHDYAHPGIVQARYGHLAWYGGFAAQGQPIGREALLTAMLAGMDGVRGKTLYYAGLSALMSPQHHREIGDIEPLGPCREVRPGVHSCRLLLARNDMLSAADTTVLAISVLQQGDFTFTRGAGGKGWSVTPQFAEELAQARVQ